MRCQTEIEGAHSCQREGTEKRDSDKRECVCERWKQASKLHSHLVFEYHILLVVYLHPAQNNERLSQHTHKHHSVVYIYRTSKVKSEKSLALRKVVTTISLLGLTALFALHATTNSHHQEGALHLLGLESSFGFGGGGEEELVFSNEYERRKGKPIGDGIYPYERLVSVHKETHFALKSKQSAKWHVQASPTTTTTTTDAAAAVGDESLSWLFVGEGDSISHTFTEVGNYKVKAMRPDGKKFTFSLDARITRYEIRDLSESDRNKYFETLSKYYSIGQAEGVKLYGATYLAWSEVLKLHMYGAATPECDHWHDDAGMINHHVGLTWVFEQSIRMITPTVAAHYWDYTREFYEDVKWDESTIFQEDWFGSSSPSNDDHIVSLNIYSILRH
jgi:hypothetical protein